MVKLLWEWPQTMISAIANREPSQIHLNLEGLFTMKPGNTPSPAGHSRPDFQEFLGFLAGGGRCHAGDFLLPSVLCCLGKLPGVAGA